jgi:class 3 adenylate cyclase
MKILVVDDEAGIRDLCAEMLNTAGHQVSVALSGEEAVERLGEGWDIVLADITMPGIVNGNELVRRTRALGNTDVLLMTGSPDLDTAIEAMKDGAFDYLIKPFTQDALLMAVKRCDDRRQLSQELAREKALRGELDRAYTELARMEKVRESFGQFVTPEVAEFVLAHPRDFLKHGARKTVTIMFVDVRGFTAFSARVQPEEVVAVLNEIFLLVINAIQIEGGMLNKFLGDGLMAVFGAPVPIVNHAQAAARAALRAREGVDTLSASRRKLGLDPLRIGIGLNTGEVVAGCVGTTHRAEYSVIGHAVNLAARLESIAAAGQVLVGPETLVLLRDAFELSGTIALKVAGVVEPVPMAELIAEKRGTANPERTYAGAYQTIPRNGEA